MATVLTVVALPFLWSSKQHQSGAESVAAIGAGAPVGDPVQAAAPGPAQPAIGDPAYLTAAPGAGSLPANNGVVTIDVGIPTGSQEAAGQATYRRWNKAFTSSDAPCGSTLAPFGARIVVTNTDNGFKVACTNSSTKPLPAGVVVVLDTDVFLQLADLGDAPIHVQISW